jgi:hypothetical protein
VTWDGTKARAALATALEAQFANAAPPVSVFSSPPGTFNAPALIVQYPLTVAISAASIGVDLASWTVLGAVGVDQADALDVLLQDAAAVVRLDPTLGRVVQATKTTELRNWRLLHVAGVELLTAELALESRM